MDNNPTTAAPAEHVLAPTPFGSKERYAWEACTIQLTLTLHPEDGHPQGRLVTLAAWTHGDPPLVRTSRRNEMGGGWPAPLRELLAELRAALPERERLASERQRLEAEKAAKDAAAEAKRKEEAAARRSPATKTTKPSGVKKGAASTTAAPASEAAQPAPVQPPTSTPPPAAPAPAEDAVAQGSLFDASTNVLETKTNHKEDEDHGQDSV